MRHLITLPKTVCPPNIERERILSVPGITGYKCVPSDSVITNYLLVIPMPNGKKTGTHHMPILSQSSVL
jgi:hypothetical protein